ncbi:hypothetical protein GCM10027346_25530 [Hymenobacter seoulensis]
MNSHVPFYIGTGLTLALLLLGLEKQLRNNSLLKIILSVTLFIGCLGFYIRSPAYQSVGANAADSLWSPFFFILSYVALSWVYIRIYQQNPTYYRNSWYDPNEGRNQNWLDVVVHLVPLPIGLLLPMFITHLLK